MRGFFLLALLAISLFVSCGGSSPQSEVSATPGQVGTVNLPTLVRGAEPIPSIGSGLFVKFDLSRNGTYYGSFLVRCDIDNAPLSSCLFAGLALGSLGPKPGKPFYDGLSFHRVRPNYLVQGGSPTGTDEGKIDLTIPDESKLTNDGYGVIGLVRPVSGTASCQFYITLIQRGEENALADLDPMTNVFGRIVVGQNVVENIAVGDVMERVTVYRNGTAASSFALTKEHLDQLAATSEKKAGSETGSFRDQQLQRISTAMPELKKAPSGLLYYIGYPTEGAVAKTGSKVTIHYVLELADETATVLDDTRERNSPLTFTIGKGDRPIAGLEEGVIGMHVGEQKLIVLPPELAYGSTGAKFTSPSSYIVPPDSYLIFLVELMEVK